MSGVAHRRTRPAPPTRRRERGSVLPLVAASMVVVVLCAALTIDLGRVSTLRRDLQNVADAAALDLVRMVDGRGAAAIVADPRWDGALVASLDRNGFERDAETTVAVRLGHHDVATDVFTEVVGEAVPSAVAVEVTDRVEHEMAPGGTTSSRRAVAAQTASAGIQVGSFAARLDSGRSALLAPLLGSALGVDAVSYAGLAGARVGLDGLATELDLSLASPEQLLATELDVVELVAAQAELLRRAGDVARATVLDQLAVRLPPSLDPVRLGDLLVLAPGGAAAAAATTVDVLELLMATALVAHRDGALAIPGLSLGVPGVASTSVTAHVVEAPRVGFGGPGTTVRTAQVRLQARVDLSAVGLVGASLQVGLEVAPTEAVIGAVSCGRPQALSLDVASGLVRTTAEVSARIAVSLLGLADVVVGDAGVRAEGGRAAGAVPLDLTFPPSALGAPTTVGPGTIGLADLSLRPTLALLPSAQLPVLLQGVLGLVTSTAEGLVTGTLTPLVATAVTALDAAVLQPLLGLLGATVPGADVTPLAIRCTGPRLVH